jgi:hypothetical protein
MNIHLVTVNNTLLIHMITNHIDTSANEAYSRPYASTEHPEMVTLFPDLGSLTVPIHLIESARLCATVR